MINELAQWETGNSGLAKIGEEVEKINEDFGSLACSLLEATDTGVPDRFLAQGLFSRIKAVRGQLADLSVSGEGQQADFDRLAKNDFEHSLKVQEQYIHAFFPGLCGQRVYIKEFLKSAYHKDGLEFFKKLAGEFDWRGISERRMLMKDIGVRGVELNPLDFEAMLLEKIPFFRKILGDYEVSMGFSTRDQVNASDEIARNKERGLIKNRIRSLFGFFDETIPTGLLAKTLGQERAGRKELKPVDRVIQELVYSLVLSGDEFCYFTWTTNSMEVTSDRMHFFWNKDMTKIDSYLLDAVRSLGHENFHKWQGILSKGMPLGLKGLGDGYSLTSRVITEGVPFTLEDPFVGWLDVNKETYGFSDTEIRLARLYNAEWASNRLTRFLRAVYNRLTAPLEKKTANSSDWICTQLAKATGNPAYLDDVLRTSESLVEVGDFAFYFAGQQYVTDTLKQLENIETARFRDRDKAKEYLAKNQGVVIQGLLTGMWGWKTHQDFFLKHYWPKAREHCVEA